MFKVLILFLVRSEAHAHHRGKPMHVSGPMRRTDERARLDKEILEQAVAV